METINKTVKNVFNKIFPPNWENNSNYNTYNILTKDSKEIVLWDTFKDLPNTTVVMIGPKAFEHLDYWFKSSFLVGNVITTSDGRDIPFWRFGELAFVNKSEMNYSELEQRRVSVNYIIRAVFEYRNLATGASVPEFGLADTAVNICVNNYSMFKEENFKPSFTLLNTDVFYQFRDYLKTSIFLSPNKINDESIEFDTFVIIQPSKT